MPTTGLRRRFINAAVSSFLAQQYPRKELIIVDEPGSQWRHHGPGRHHAHDDALEWWYSHPEVRVLSLFGEPLSIGAKRNLALAQAHGEIICHWDDDDEYASDRLSRQVAPIAAGEADITGMPLELVKDLTRGGPHGKTWRCSQALADALFACGVHGGTLMYRRVLWNATAAFENVSSGEDGGFLRLLLARGARLTAVENNGSFVYVRHDPMNLWPLGEELSREDWTLVDGEVA